MQKEKGESIIKRGPIGSTMADRKIAESSMGDKIKGGRKKSPYISQKGSGCGEITLTRTRGDHTVLRSVREERKEKCHYV